MSAADLLLLIVGCYFIVRGLFRGITGELFSLLSVAGGSFCALRFYGPMSTYLSDRLGVARLITTSVCMLAIFFIVFVVCSLADKAIKKLISGINLTWADKTGGGFAGLIKLYMISVLVLVAGMIVSPMTGDTWVRESKVLTVTAWTWPIVYPALDSLGVLPDLAELQREAKEYIVRQAAGSLFGPNTDFGALLPRSGDVTSGDMDPAVSADAARSTDAALSIDVSALTDPAQLASTVQALSNSLPAELQRNKMLDFFLGWGGGENK
ncbi:MAG: CvpA family protein [Synergistaceae bacterium]|jgi:uncharacterized membrane protein required for colicin V production|nr:CvpA family protein [Synergistaceae bacterium]